MTTVVLKKSNVEKQKGVVVLPIKEYERLLARTIPTYYLAGKEAERADVLVERGMQEYRAGKTIEARSVREALRRYRNAR